MDKNSHKLKSNQTPSDSLAMSNADYKTEEMYFPSDTHSQYHHYSPHYRNPQDVSMDTFYDWNFGHSAHNPMLFHNHSIHHSYDSFPYSEHMDVSSYPGYYHQEPGKMHGYHHVNPNMADTHSPRAQHFSLPDTHSMSYYDDMGHQPMPHIYDRAAYNPNFFPEIREPLHPNVRAQGLLQLQQFSHSINESEKPVLETLKSPSNISRLPTPQVTPNFKFSAKNSSNLSNTSQNRVYESPIFRTPISFPKEDNKTSFIEHHSSPTESRAINKISQTPIKIKSSEDPLKRLPSLAKSYKPPEVKPMPDINEFISESTSTKKKKKNTKFSMNELVNDLNNVFSFGLDKPRLNNRISLGDIRRDQEDYPVPHEYLIYHSIKRTIPDYSCKSFNDDLLFYLYYSLEDDSMKLSAIANLIARRWKFHTVNRTWIKLPPNYKQKDSYTIFDPNKWKRVTSNDIIDVKKFESKTYHEYIDYQAKVALSQTGLIDDDSFEPDNPLTSSSK